jgi:hypothetical protein
MAGMDRRGAVFVLTLGDDENRFHPDRLAAINAALDEVEAAEGPKAVVTTGAGKFYSNGLDLDFMASHPDASESNLRDVHALFARVLASGRRGRRASRGTRREGGPRVRGDQGAALCRGHRRTHRSLSGFVGPQGQAGRNHDRKVRLRCVGCAITRGRLLRTTSR